MPKSVACTTGFQTVAIGLVAAAVTGLFTLALAGGGPRAVDATLSSGAALSQAVLPPRMLSAAAREDRPSRLKSITQATFANAADIHLVSSAGKLSALFTRIGYELDGVRLNGQVPRLFIASLPHDLKALAQPKHRKVVFIKSTLPLILHVNELIMQDRERLFRLRDQAALGVTPSSADAAWLTWMADSHDLDRIDFTQLLQRVDVIPPSLAIAQAAEESGWGTSRFAREGNSLFGQRSFDDQKSGIVPLEREDGDAFKVRAFDHLIDGVKAYMGNLNSHAAYDRFRELRSEMRAAGETIDGYRLVEALDRYSERGRDYVETIRTIMRVNGLEMFDGARLGEQISGDEQSPDA